MSLTLKFSYLLLGDLSAASAQLGRADAEKFDQIAKRHGLEVDETTEYDRHVFRTAAPDEIALEVLSDLLDGDLDFSAVANGIFKDDDLGGALRWAYATRGRPLGIEFVPPR